MTEQQVPAGWYDDGSGRDRWWNGADWTHEYQSVPNVAPSQPAVPAGWYPDTNRTATLRYWNGDDWEDHFAPMPSDQAAAQVGTTQPAAVYVVEKPEENNSGTITAGYIFAILFPIIGFIIGLTQINKKGGVGVIAASVVAFFVWYQILTANGY